jgi:hypothetical protein
MKSLYSISLSLLNFLGLYLTLSGWLALTGITEALVTYEWQSIYGLYTTSAIVFLTILFHLSILSIKSRYKFSYEDVVDFQYSFMRFVYSSNILMYGFSKIFKGQFQYGIITADTPVGELSSTILTWYYFGQSYVFACIVGSLQIIASVLIYFRRTSLLGLLMMLPLMANITMINFFYDLWFETQLVSIAYLLMNLLLLMPYWQSLKILLIDISIVQHKIQKSAMILFSASILIPIYGFYKIRNDEKAYYTKGELFGGYKSVAFAKNDTSVNVLHLDNRFWQKVYFDRGNEGKLITSQDSSSTFTYYINSDSLTFTFLADSTQKFKGKFSFSGSDTLSLNGQINHEFYQMLLKRLPIKEPIF